METFFQKMGLAPADPLAYADCFRKAKAAMAARGDGILRFEDAGIFTWLTKDLCRIRQRAAEDPDNLLYCWFLAEVLRTGDNALIGQVSHPRKEAEDELYDTLPLFSILERVPDMKASLRARGVPEDVITDTAEMLQNQTGDHIALYKRCGIAPYVEWMTRFLTCRIIRVGRFNLEMTVYDGAFDFFQSKTGEMTALPREGTFHKCGQVLGSVGCEDADGAFSAVYAETESYYEGLSVENGTVKNRYVRLPKEQWMKTVTKGTKVISVHIPSGGALTPEICTADLKRGKEVINRCFGEFPVLYCHSWLLEPALRAILGKETNLTRFSDRFCRVPVMSTGMDVFGYVYNLREIPPLHTLSEESSLARCVKLHLISGGHVWGAAGIMME